MHQARNFVPNNWEVVGHSGHRLWPPSWRSVVEKGYAIKVRHPVPQRRLNLVAVDTPGHRWNPVVRGPVQAQECETGVPAWDDVENHFRRGEPMADPANSVRSIAGWRYISRPWATINTSAIGSTASIQAGSRALVATWRNRSVGARKRSRRRIASGRSTESNAPGRCRRGNAGFPGPRQERL